MACGGALLSRGHLVTYFKDPVVATAVMRGAPVTGRGFYEVPAMVMVPKMHKIKARLTKLIARLNLKSRFYSEQLRIAQGRLPSSRHFQFLANLQEH